jgi:hypothetical protein
MFVEGSHRGLDDIQKEIRPEKIKEEAFQGGKEQQSLVKKVRMFHVSYKHMDGRYL